MSIKKSQWNTYKTTCYTYDVANDPASTGGVHYYQIRWWGGRWQQRICQSNGNHSSYSSISSLDHEDGAAHYERATTY